jgi:TolA-binding protein
MKTLLSLLGFAMCLLLSSCSSMTMLRTKEIKEASESSAAKINKRLDSLMLVVDSLKMGQIRDLSRLKADFADLSSRVVDQNGKTEARMEEINYRLDRILSVVQQKSVVTKSAAGSDKSAEQARKAQEMETLYNASRADYLRAEYAVAYNGFKQIYETLETGEMAENSLYWMGMCMQDAGRNDNATVLFKSLLEKFPQSPKVCTVNFRLASMAEESGSIAGQKAYLQKLLGTEHCAPSNEFQRAADILQGN